MENNDLGPGRDISRRCGVVFEHLIATPPKPGEVHISWPRQIGKRLFAQRYEERGPESFPLHVWHLNELPYLSLRYMESRSIAVEVYSFLRKGEDMHSYWIDAIDQYLGRMGVFPYRTLCFDDPAQLATYLRGNLEVRTVFVPTTEQAAVIGLRASVATPGTPLNF